MIYRSKSHNLLVFTHGVKVLRHDYDYVTKIILI